jgi:hypothetical protein
MSDIRRSQHLFIVKTDRGKKEESMIGVNSLILKKIDLLNVSDETKKIIKDLLMVEFMNQQRGIKTFFDQYDDIFSKDLGVQRKY